MVTPGTVYLVGAGPGDPGLITWRGLEILRAADVVVHDRLVSGELLAEAAEEAEIIPVGKSPGAESPAQEDINRLLADLALTGRSVCRLKGGDPFLFGRGAEEASYLAERGVRFEVVPGVTSALAAPAYAGIPVTDRRFASSVAIVTGHRAAGGAPSWASLAGAADTLVVLMGMARLGEIAEWLVRGGRSPATPAAVVCEATTGRQKAVVADLAGIAEAARREGVTPPGVLVVGRVVALAAPLRWYGAGPLAGRRVIVTRPRRQAAALARALRALGAEPLICPVIRVEHIGAEPPRLRELLAQRWDWALFTSANAVEHFGRQLRESGLDWRALAGAQLAAIGDPTAAALERLGLLVAFMPTRALTRALADELPVGPGSCVLALRALGADSGLARALAARGAHVREHPTHRTVPDEPGARALAELLARREADLITFTSASAARAAVAAVGPEPLAALEVVCIGPVTARAARSSGLLVSCEAQEHTAHGLAEAIAAHCRPAERVGEGVTT